MRKSQQPVLNEVKIARNGNVGGETYDHPAYGTIQLSTLSGGSKTLFGSDIGHHQTVKISIHRASLTRNLGRDWIHGECMPIVEVEMSHAQFANFITSNGNGNGNPCTLRYTAAKDAKIEEMPAIENIQTKHETHHKEIRDAAEKMLSDLNVQVKALGDLIESGKTGKKDLSAIQFAMKNIVIGIPSNMDFVVKSAEEALETATSHAKIEVEAYVTATAQRLGFESISEFAKLENKSTITKQGE